MLPLKKTLTVPQGQTWSDLAFTVYDCLRDVDGEPILDVDGNLQQGDPLDISTDDGYTARLHIREKQGGTIIVECTTENGDITLNDPQGHVEVIAPAAKMSLLTKKKMYADLELVWPTGEPVQRLVDVVLEVTRNYTQATGEPVLK